jgi:mono/diheme cytochrome c family protein
LYSIAVDLDLPQLNGQKRRAGPHRHFRLPADPTEWLRRAQSRYERIGFVISRRMLFRAALPLALYLLAALPAHALTGSKTQAAAQAGAVLFRDKGCAHCHGAGGAGGKKGPDLTGLRKDKLWTPAKIADQILNGGQKMPSFGDSVTDGEVAQLIAYLRAKHRPVPPPAN